MFRRLTDDEMYRRLGKRPLDVGADRIARTAHSALSLLDGLRKPHAGSIPLAWDHDAVTGVQALEVYPAATRVAYERLGVAHLEDGVTMEPAVAERRDEFSAHEEDALVCAIAARDFLEGWAVAPTDEQKHCADVEGWIWVRTTQGAETPSHRGTHHRRQTSG